MTKKTVKKATKKATKKVVKKVEKKVVKPTLIEEKVMLNDREVIKVTDHIKGVTYYK